MRNAPREIIFDSSIFGRSLAGATPAIAAEDTSPPSVTSHEVNVLRQVAIALAAGVMLFRISAVRRLRILTWTAKASHARNGLRHCSIPHVCRMLQRFAQQKRSRGYVRRIIDYVQAALPSDSWRQVEAVPYTGLIRSISYQHWKSGAQIDVDLVAQPTWYAQPLYCVRVFGWKRF